MKRFWNWLLVFLGLRAETPAEIEADQTPPAWPAVPHVYDAELDGRVYDCCTVCGGGRRHEIHTTERSAYAVAAFSGPTTREESADLFYRYGNVGRSIEELLSTKPTVAQLDAAVSTAVGNGVPLAAANEARRLMLRRGGLRSAKEV